MVPHTVVSYRKEGIRLVVKNAVIRYEQVVAAPKYRPITSATVYEMLLVLGDVFLQLVELKKKGSFFLIVHMADGLVPAIVRVPRNRLFKLSPSDDNRVFDVVALIVECLALYPSFEATNSDWSLSTGFISLRDFRRNSIF